MNALNPARIFEVGMACWPSRVLQTAVKLGLFTALGDKSMTGRELQKALDLHDRANPDFFDTLVALKFLDRDGDGPEGRYRNTQETATFLVKTSPAYIGGFLEMAHDRLYRFWGDLDIALKTGEPQNEIKISGKSMFAELYAKPERLEQFMDAMTGASLGNFIALADKFDFSKYKTLTDIGGAAGVLSMMVARAHPKLAIRTADLPEVTKIAQRKIDAAGLSDRIKAVNVDFFEDAFPKSDVITMGMILHDWDLPTKMMLIRKAYDALPEGGAFIVIEALIDDARRENAFGMMMSLNMLVEFGVAFDYTGADFTRWCKEAGFKRTEVIPLAGQSSAAVAYK
ncbi:MAG: methyltransferase [Parvularculaceae bacterium]